MTTSNRILSSRVSSSRLSLVASAVRSATLTHPRRQNTIDHPDESTRPSLASSISHAPLSSHGRPSISSAAKLTRATEPRLLTRLLSSCRTPNELLTLLQHHSTSLNDIHLSASMVLLAKYKGDNGHAMTSCVKLMAPLIDRKMTRESSRAIANIIWSSAKLIERINNLPPSPLLSSSVKSLLDLSSSLLLHHLPICISQFNAQHLSNTAYALSILSKNQTNVNNEALINSLPNLLVLILNRAQYLFSLQEFKEPQAIANLLYSLSSMSHSPESRWMDQCLDACEPILHQFEPMHISSTLTALSSLSYHPGEAWLASAMNALRMKLRISSPQSISNVLWSIAKLGCQDELSSGGVFLETVEEMLQEVASRAPFLSSHDCSTILWSLAKLNLPSNERHLKIQQSLVSQMSKPLVLQKAVPQDISNALWAVSVLWTHGLGQSRSKYEQRINLEVIALRLTQSSDMTRGTMIMAQCKPQELSNVALAVARLGLMVEGWWQALWGASLPLLSPPSPPLSWNVEPQHISNMLWAAAKSRQQPPDAWISSALAAFDRGAMEGRATDQAIACILWSLARMDHAPTLTALETLLGSFSLEEASDQGLSMIFWALSRMKKQASPHSTRHLLRSSLDRMTTVVYDRVNVLGMVLGQHSFVVCLKVMSEAEVSLNLSKGQKEKLVEATYRALPKMGMREARSVLKSLITMGYRPGPRMRALMADRVKQT